MDAILRSRVDSAVMAPRALTFGASAAGSVGASVTGPMLHTSFPMTKPITMPMIIAMVTPL